MVNRTAIPKKQLLRIIQRFLRDRDRGISKELFANLAGIHVRHLLDVFDYETEPMTEMVQYRVSKAYTEWKNGEVLIMQNRDRTKFLDYRKEAKPVLERGLGLQVQDGQIKIKLGIQKKYDYDRQTLDEQLERG
jgi:hypothetical protein